MAFADGKFVSDNMRHDNPQVPLHCMQQRADISCNKTGTLLPYKINHMTQRNNTPHRRQVFLCLQLLCSSLFHCFLWVHRGVEEARDTHLQTINKCLKWKKQNFTAKNTFYFLTISNICLCYNLVSIAGKLSVMMTFGNVRLIINTTKVNQ